jgi:hypothetical protein
MTTINDGGPAFPMSYDNSLAYTYPSHQGMTLRDYFAAKAMQALLGYEESTLQNDAEVAYQMADAMLKEREA